MKSEISWQTVAVLGLALAASVAVFFGVPGEYRSEALLGTNGGFAIVLALTRALIVSKRDDDDDGSGGNPLNLFATPASGLKRNGHISQRLPKRPLTRVMSLLALLSFSGCGSSALRTHATIGTVAAVSLQASHGALVTSCTTLRDACADDACVARVRSDCTTAADAQDAAVAVVRAYLDAIEVASLADEGRVASALFAALDAAVNAWESLGRALGAVGYTLPALPAWGAQ